MPILGLVSTESYASERFKNVRRSVQYFYPNGAAPLAGFMSLMDDEDTDDPEFSWYEKRMRQQTTTTASQGTSKGPFLTSVGADAGDPVTLTAETTYEIKVAATENFRVGHVIKVPLATGGSTLTDWKSLVTEIVSSTVLKVRAITTLAAVDNGATNENVGREVLVIGSAFSQGIQDISSEVYTLPSAFTNFCQIFRTPFSITGTALKTSAKFDDTGVYKDKAKEHSLYNMIEMEKAFIWGPKSGPYADPVTGLPTYTSGGILHFLQRWEAGDYASVTATADSDDDKRIITNAAGTMSEDTYDTYLERVFRVTNNKSNEKLVLCGSGFLKVMNQLYRSKSVLNADLPLTDTYGMNVVSHLTPFGTVYYKTHPLFTQNPTLRYNALFCDVSNLKYRYVQGRDLELLKNREPNDADYRKDEWLGECGLEVWFPESFMYMQNVRSYVP